MKHFTFLKPLLMALMLVGGVNCAWGQVSVPDPVYFNDFSSTDGLTIIGSGEFTTDADVRFGAIYQNNPSKNTDPRTNYLKLPASTLTHSGTSNAMTIGFWVNKKNADDYNWYPIFSAYGSSKPGSENGMPMLVFQARGLLQVNDNAGNWSDYKAEQNDASANTEDVTWLTDANWHYYTVTLTPTKAIVYIDGVVLNSWTLDGTSDGQKLSGLFSGMASGNYPVVCLGGNQAWGWGDKDPAFAFDDFVVYDQALTASQIEKIIEDKVYTTVTYDFTSYSNRTLSNSETRAFNANSTNHFYASNLPEVYDRFAFQFAGTFSIENEGLYAQRTSGDHIGILGLSAQDKVKINFSQGAIMVRGAVPTWAGITQDWTAYTTGTEITTTVAGNISFQAKNSCKISSIVIKTKTFETVTAPAIASKANGDERTITITEGVSNLNSCVTTYYTTDGSTPTSASTLYTAPFNVNATCTIKAITISQSSAATASTVTEELIDMDMIDTPTASITAVDGNNRTITFACGTAGTTLSYSIKTGEETWADYVTANTLVISENTTLKVKATKNANEAVSDELSFEAGTAITLNAPTYTIGAYSDNKYILTLTSNQSDKLLSPVADIKYTVNDGEVQTIASGATVDATVGSTYKFWTAAVGYTNSSEVTATPSYIDFSSYRAEWTTDFQALAVSLEAGSGGKVLTRSETPLVEGYYNITNEGFNNKFGVNNLAWQIRFRSATDKGLWPYNISGSMVVTELTAGDVIVFTSRDPIYAGNNVAKDEFVSQANNNYTFVVAADGNATFSATRSGYIYSVTVYTQRPENYSASISEAGWATLYTPYALDFSSLSSNFKAYTATVEGSTVTLTEVSNVPANTGVVLNGEEGSYNIPVIASSLTDRGSLTGNATEATDYNAFDGYYLYMLALNADNKAQFTKVTGGYIGAGKAYLKLSTSVGVKSFNVVFNDIATGVDEIAGSKFQVSGTAIYNVAGQRVSQPTRGLYIKNGKKIIIK